MADRVGEVPERARAEVDRNLSSLDTQVAEANRRLAQAANEGDADFDQNAVLGPLEDKREATLARIGIAIKRAGGQRPTGLKELAACTVVDDGTGGDAGAADPGAEDPGTADPGAEDPGAGEETEPAEPAEPAAPELGPTADDFVAIREVPRQRQPRIGRRGSAGTIRLNCGTNEDGHFNSDNYIVAPNVSNGAQHTHDYVGNSSTDAFSTDENLDAADTTCTNGDKSVFYWPVVRTRDAEDVEQQSDQSATDLNFGTIETPASVSLEFRGNARANVVAMPRFMRIVTGDAKAVTNGPTNARAKWTCSGFTSRISTDKYPICPRRSRTMRILDFPSCWDGQNIDSANHRTHVVFPDAQGACPAGTRPVPQLRMTISYNVRASVAQINEGVLFALDSFPNEKHNAGTDHGDFENLMTERQMRRTVSCINRDRRCRA